MAEKKYLDLTQLTTYDTKLKAHIDQKDAAALQSAKDYADGLAKNYDAAGTAQTKMEELANGQVKTNTEAIAKLNGAADAEGSVAKAVADAKTALETKIDAAKKAGDDAQTDVDALEALVGTLPEGTAAQTVVAYVDAKTSGIATDASLKDLTNRVTTAEGKITTAEGEIDTLQTDVDAVEDKVATLVSTDTGKSARTIANEELAKQLIADGADEKLDTLQEIAAWIQQHPKDAAAMNQAIEALKTKVGDIPEGADASTIVAYIQKLVSAEETRAEGIESGLDTRVKAIEGKFGDGTGSVATQIATAKQEAIEAAANDATTKANKAKTDAVAAAKTYTDTEVGKVSAVAEANKTGVSDLKTRMTAAEKDIDDLQTAIGADGSVTASIAAAKKAGTDAAAAVTTLENGQVATNKSNIEKNAADITSLKSKVGDGFVAITEAEINALFATPQA
nr:MAG TPA: hypothetical protein [Caudoviricetes sp.]